MTVTAARADGALLVEARDIHVTLGEREVLCGVSMAVRSGEVVSIIGPNGAGKSTLIRVLMGVARPDRGSVTRKPGLTVGYVPQRMEIDPALPLNVWRFLAVACRDRNRIEEALAEVGVPDAAPKAVQALSGGELRRVMLARAILREPDLLVLDEPLAGVDVAGQAELYRLIGQLRRRYRAGVLMVSHDLHLVMAETDSVICLNGHVCCAGHPEAVSRDPAYAALFGATLDRTVALYTHAHDHVHDGAGHVVPLAEHAHDGPDEGTHEGERVRHG